MRRAHSFPIYNVLSAYCRPLSCLTACVVVAALLLPHPPASALSATPSQWQRFPTPTQHDLLIVPGADIDRFCIGGNDDLTLYAIGTWNSPCTSDMPVDPHAPDGFIFAQGQATRLWKSSDGGNTWTDRTSRVLAAAGLPGAGAGEYGDFLAFTAVASAPDDADIILVAGYDKRGTPVVVASSNGADDFEWVGCDTMGGIILCLSISPLTDEKRDIAVGTIDPIGGGKIWRRHVGNYWTEGWKDTSTYGGWVDSSHWNGNPTHILAVTSINFSPSYLIDHSIAASIIAHAEEADGDPYDGFFTVLGCWDSSPAWNAAAGFMHYPVLIRESLHLLHAPSSLPLLLLRELASIALPADFNADIASRRTILIAVNGELTNPVTNSRVTEGGFLFWLQGCSISDDMLAREENPWVASVAYSGSSDMRGRILLGTLLPDSWTISDIEDWFDTGIPSLPCCNGVQVLLSEDNDPCCPHWSKASQPPSGQFNAQVEWTDDGSLAFASTSGAGRLWQHGEWFADESAFSASSTPSLSWEQTGLIDTMIHRIVDLSCDHSLSTLCLHTSHSCETGAACKCESVWRTASEGLRWIRVLHGSPATSKADKSAFDDLMRRYRRGFFKPVMKGYLSTAGARYIIGDAIDPKSEEQVEAAFKAGAIYRLQEGSGDLWEDMAALTLNYEGLIHMDCSGAPGTALYAGFDNLWWDYTDNCPLPYPDSGGSTFCPIGHECRMVSGAARVLGPDRPDCCQDWEWDYLICGLNGQAETGDPYEQFMLAGASCTSSSVTLWAIDTGNRYWADGGGDAPNYDWCTGEFADSRWGRLWTYNDCHAVAATTTIVGDTPVIVLPDSCYCAHEEFSLQWERTCDGCEYEIEVALDRRFNHVVLNTSTFVPGKGTVGKCHFYRPTDPCAPGLLLREGMLDCNQQYWWRVRAHLAETGEVIASWWSEPQSFYIAPCSPACLELGAPGDGATGVAISNVAFTWSAVSGATTYDFMLVDQGRGHVASQICGNTYFILPLELKYDSSYMWRVIALNGDRVIAESARSTFRTAPRYTPASYADPGATIIPPAPPYEDDWGWYFAAILVLMLTSALASLSYVNRSRRRHRRASARRFS